jgi:hypothetical protein
MQNNDHLTVVMYHYVRPIANSRYSGIKGLELDDFEKQLNYIQNHYLPVTVAEVCEALDGRKRLPNQAILLTFDDGYSDHYLHVFPALARRKIQGVFFAPVEAIRERRILDVNKIQFVLSCCKNHEQIVRGIDEVLSFSGEMDVSEYKAKYLSPSRYDPPETMYIKRMLQFALPESQRKKMIDKLFEAWVTSDLESFADELYATEGHGDRGAFTHTPLAQQDRC